MSTTIDRHDPRYQRDDAQPVPGTLYDDFCRPPGYSVYYAIKHGGALAFRIEIPTADVTPDRLARWREMAREIVFGDSALRVVR